MQDFKKFIIQIQTFVITPKNIDEVNNSNTLFELRESALTDILNQPEEQILYQVQRLELIEQTFVDFWTNHDTIPDYTREAKATYFACLELESYFNIVSEKKLSPHDISEAFIYDLLKAIKKRKALLSDFIWSIKRAINKKTEQEIEQKDNKNETVASRSFKGLPTFKTEVIIELFDLLKDYFAVEDRDLLFTILQNSDIKTDNPLLFYGNGNQLADAFKQLIDANLIVGCNKAELSLWIKEHFSFKDKNSPKIYTEKYLNDIISSDTKTCQSPILDIKKRENGQYGVFPTQRIKKNYKKY